MVVPNPIIAARETLLWFRIPLLPPEKPSSLSQYPFMGSQATAPSCYGHTTALAFQPPLYMRVYCKANPMPASGAYPLEIRSTAAKTQADATLPCIGVRGGAKRRITPGPHSQPFGGAR